jgi:hypothetical protein
MSDQSLGTLGQSEDLCEVLVPYQRWCEDAVRFGLDPSEMVGLVVSENGWAVQVTVSLVDRSLDEVW